MNTNSFARSDRLTTPADYNVVFSSPAIRISNRFFLLLCQPNQLGRNRLGLVVGKKHVRKAVCRNRIKRLARESFRQRSESQSIDIVFLAKAGLLKLTNQELLARLDEAWSAIEQKASS